MIYQIAESIISMLVLVFGIFGTIAIMLFLFVYSFSWSINRLSGWHKKGFRENFYYWVSHKEEIDIIIKEKNIKK